KLQPHRPVRLRRVHVENSAASRVLSRHLHHVRGRIAHTGKVRQQRLHIYFLATSQHLRQSAIERRRKQLHGRRFHRSNHDGGTPGSHLPKRRCPCLLNLGVGRHIFKGK